MLTSLGVGKVSVPASALPITAGNRDMFLSCEVTLCMKISAELPLMKVTIMEERRRWTQSFQAVILVPPLQVLPHKAT